MPVNQNNYPHAMADDPVTGKPMEKAGYHKFGSFDRIKSGSLYGSISIGTSATPVRVGGSDLATRHTLLIVNDDPTNSIYIGFDASVTVANGIPIRPNEERQLLLDPVSGLTIYGIASVSTSVVVAEMK
ncbi:hypothetical protein E2K98_21955 [Bacillus salipaludis]|uniref:Uncharacterized protein n=1 Tax=Bacillus salipaludis TaxID=2547811 RepID=A0A4R5VLX2_9BACI|nr:hypothetical protein [Bacillus salipaludis]MDQ6599232.1 hypothetical protein [Bacillus salipaludis]TDK58876.1 hypothetical protein E2K98_21955 [Bacillus salipaludis]